MRKKKDKTENSDLRNPPTSQAIYLAPKCLFIIASIVINYEKKFGMNRCKIH